MPLSYSVSAWAWALFWNDDCLPLLDRAKGLGFDVLEIPLFVTSQMSAAATRERADAVGIGVSGCLGCPPQADPTGDDRETRQKALDYLKEHIQVTADMGAFLLSGTVYAAGRRPQSLPTSEHWERSAAVLKEAARFAANLGVTLGLEPVNRFEGFLINTAAQALKLKEMIGEPNVKLLLDSFHMNIEEDNLGEAIAGAAPHLCHFHLCENHRGEIGTGHVDFDEVFGTLAKAGYSGQVGLEFFGAEMAVPAGLWRGSPQPVDDVLARSLATLKRLEAKHWTAQE